MKTMVAAVAVAMVALGSPVSAAAPAKKAAPAAARDWSKTVVKTAEGGYRMGSPSAKVTLVEYGSMTCSHCAHFDEVGYPQLVQNYVKTGKVAFEFRNYVRDPYDMAAALTARCGGAQRFFGMTNDLFRTRETWIKRVREGQEKLKAYEGKPPAVFLPAISTLAGFDSFGGARGVPAATVQRCMANQAEIDKVMAIRNTASGVEGTPTFFVNGTEVDMSNATDYWPAVEASLKAALAG